MAHIVGVVGSLRKESYNRKLMNAFMSSVPEGTTITEAPIAGLPLYNEDIESEAVPESVQAFKQAIEVADAIVIATPEYNRGVPGVLKNAVDWASRPDGENSFSGKTVLVVGASSGSIGAAVAQYDLKQSLLHLNATVLGQPEFHLGTAGEKFAEDGTLTDERTQERIKSAIAALVARV
ncbi:MAG: NAD(P)H-dependent oxidoreductase [Candidatus Paceibacterota bacterium]